MTSGNISAEEWRDLVEVGKGLTSAVDLEQILGLIMDKVQSRVRASNWSLLLTDPKTGNLRFHLVKGIDPASVVKVELKPGEGVAGTVLKTGEALFVRDVQADLAFTARVDRLTGFQTKSIVCLPLKFEGRVLGVIEVVNLTDFDSFIQRQVPLLQVLTDYAAIAIEKANIIERLHRQTITDSLTGLYNDRFLYSYLQHELELARSTGEPYAIVFLDLDNFKQVVDTYGHLAGSDTLKSFAEFLKKHLIPKFAAVRFGGDEFVLLMPGCTAQAATARTEQLREWLRDEVFAPVPGASVKLTASFGVAVFPDDAAEFKALLAKADDAMYRVKKKSKDAVSC